MPPHEAATAKQPARSGGLLLSAGRQNLPRRAKSGQSVPPRGGAPAPQCKKNSPPSGAYGAPSAGVRAAFPSRKTK